MNIAKTKSLDMTTGTIWKELVEYAVPLLLGNLLQQLYTVVDCVTVGQLVGKEALAAISATEILISIVLGMFIGISMGATIIIAQSYGAKDDDGLNKAVQTTASLTVIIGILVTAAGLVFTRLILKLMSTPADVFDYAEIYLKIYFAGIIGQVIYNMASGILRAVGDSQRPLIALAITSVLNIVLDLLFVAVFKLGVVGVAVATVISQLVSAVYLTWLLVKTDDAYRVDLSQWTIHKETSRKIFAVGVPIGLQRTIVSLSNTVVVSKVNYFGAGALAAWGVFRKIEELILNGMQSLSLAISTFVGQNIGAGHHARTKEGAKTGMILTLAFTIATSIICILFRKYIVMIFNSSEEVLTYGSLAILVMLPFIWVNAAFQAVSGELRGMGNGNAPMIIALVGFVVFRQIYLYAIWEVKRTLALVYFSFPVGWIFAALIILVYKKVVWKKYS